MSRAYRVRQSVQVKDKLKRGLSASDEICTDLELLEILPPEAMGELLKDALRKRGFTEEEGKLVRRTGGITVTVEPTKGEVTIQVEGEQEVVLEGTKTGSVYTDDTEKHKENVRRQLLEGIRQELEKRATEEEKRLERKVSAELEASLGDISTELDQVVNEVTREALKRKAASLGQIKEMSEDPQSGSLTIKVEV